MIGAILGGLSLATQLGADAANRREVRRANAASQQHTLDMYERQRRDNQAQWHMQNEYNSPEAQMARLQKAGLNPNLVYGSGGVTQNAAPMPSVTAGSYNPEAPTFNTGSIMSSYFDTKIQQAQYDNLKAQNTVLVQDAALKAANTAATTIKGARSKFDLELAQELRSISADTSREALRKLQIQNMYQLDENQRRQLLTNSSLEKTKLENMFTNVKRAKTGWEIDKLEEEIKNLKNTGVLQRLDIELKKLGIQPGDKIYWRVAARILGNHMPSGVSKYFK